MAGTETPPVFVAMPVIDRDAHLIAGWAACVREAFPLGGCVLYAACRARDREAAAACEAAGVCSLEAPDYEIGPGRRHCYEGVATQRNLLVAAARAGGAARVWFVDADVRPTPAQWAHAAGSEGDVALTPYPVRWAGGAAVVCVGTRGEKRLVRADTLPGGAPILGGGMGCTLLKSPKALSVRFAVGALAIPQGPLKGAVAGEDVGWFLAAEDAGVDVRMAPGGAAAHVGASTPGA